MCSWLVSGHRRDDLLAASLGSSAGPAAGVPLPAHPDLTHGHAGGFLRETGTPKPAMPLPSSPGDGTRVCASPAGQHGGPGGLKTRWARLQLRDPTAGSLGAWFCWSTVTGVETAGWYGRNVMSWSCRGSSGFHLHKLSLPPQYLVQSSFDSRTVQVSLQPYRALPAGIKPTKITIFAFSPASPGNRSPRPPGSRGGEGTGCYLRTDQGTRVPASRHRCRAFLTNGRAKGINQIF